MADDDLLPAAATVVLLRDREDAGALADVDDPRASAPGVEVLLLRRPARGSFAGAWVFPGGRVDDADAGDDEDARALAAAIRETREETGLELQPADLAPLAHWTPPVEAARRFRTWFLVARAPQAEVEPAPDEVEEHRWIAPADALEAHAEGDLVLVPPTWVTLHGLVGAASVDDVLRLAASAPMPRYATHHDEAGQRFLWQDDEAYDGAMDTDDGPRHRLSVADARWVYERRPLRDAS